MWYDECKIYGPYYRKDGRQHVICIHYISGLRKTVSYPKFLVEMELGRFLEPNEIVHHIDGDFTNNEMSNLEVLDRSEHGYQHATKNMEEFTCPICKEKFTLTGKKLHNVRSSHSRRVYAGPFCSDVCLNKHRSIVNSN